VAAPGQCDPAARRGVLWGSEARPRRTDGGAVRQRYGMMRRDSVDDCWTVALTAPRCPHAEQASGMLRRVRDQGGYGSGAGRWAVPEMTPIAGLYSVENKERATGGRLPRFVTRQATKSMWVRCSTISATPGPVPLRETNTLRPTQEAVMWDREWPPYQCCVNVHASTPSISMVARTLRNQTNKRYQYMEPSAGCVDRRLWADAISLRSSSSSVSMPYVGDQFFKTAQRFTSTCVQYTYSIGQVEDATQENTREKKMVSRSHAEERKQTIQSHGEPDAQLTTDPALKRARRVHQSTLTMPRERVKAQSNQKGSCCARVQRTIPVCLCTEVKLTRVRKRTDGGT